MGGGEEGQRWPSLLSVGEGAPGDWESWWVFPASLCIPLSRGHDGITGTSACLSPGMLQAWGCVF